MSVPMKVLDMEEKSAKASVPQRIEAVFPYSKAGYLTPPQWFNYAAQSRTLEQQPDSRSNAPITRARLIAEAFLLGRKTPTPILHVLSSQ